MLSFLHQAFFPHLKGGGENSPVVSETQFIEGVVGGIAILPEMVPGGDLRRRPSPGVGPILVMASREAGKQVDVDPGSAPGAEHAVHFGHRGGNVADVFEHQG